MATFDQTKPICDQCVHYLMPHYYDEKLGRIVTKVSTCTLINATDFNDPREEEAYKDGDWWFKPLEWGAENTNCPHYVEGQKVLPIVKNFLNGIRDILPDEPEVY